MDVKTTLTSGITEGDWSKIQDVFKFLFKGQEPPKPPEQVVAKDLHYEETSPFTNLSKTEINIVRTFIQELDGHLIQAFTRYIYDDPTIDSDSLLEEDYSDLIKEPSASVVGGVKFITSPTHPEFETNEYKEHLKKHAASRAQLKKMAPRDAYKPYMIKCDACGKEFDFNKEYPMGNNILDSGKSQSRKNHCNKCRAK